MTKKKASKKVSKKTEGNESPEKEVKAESKETKYSYRAVMKYVNYQGDIYDPPREFLIES